MNYFAEIDVSLKRTAICIVDRDGNIVREGVTDTEPEALISWLRTPNSLCNALGWKPVECSSWLHKGLSEGGLPVICVETRHAKSVMQARTRQDGPQRCSCACANDANRMVQGGSHQI